MPNNETNQKDPSKSYCGRCGKEIAPVKMCKCAGGGGGGSGWQSHDNEAKAGSDKLHASTSTGAKSEISPSTNTNNENKNMSVNLYAQSRELEIKVLLAHFQSLFKQQLEINSNSKDSLSIKIKSNLPQDEKELLLQFLNILKKECDHLVFANPTNKFLADGYQATIDEKQGELKIHAPDKKLFHDIVKDLSKNASALFAKAKQQRAEQQPVAPSQNDKNSVSKTPFKTKLTRE